MKFLYLIQTHKNPEQIYRLVRLIKTANSEALIILSHDSKAAKLDLDPLKDLPGDEVVLLTAKSGRGDLSLVLAYLEALDWLEEHNIEFDWLTNLSGQCYPTQPIEAFEGLLAKAEYDGFLEYFELFSDQNGWGVRTSQDRYLYHYWRPGVMLSTWQRAALKPLKVVVNNTQPLARLQWYNGELMLGLRTQAPFDQSLTGYGGSYFHSLSRKCVKFLYDFSKSQSGMEMIEFYKKTWVPVESFLQTVLVNNKDFKLCEDNKRYMNWSATSYGHPGIVTAEDYPGLTKDNVFFARKFDINKDSQVLDVLDSRVVPSQRSNCL